MSKVASFEVRAASAGFYCLSAAAGLLSAIISFGRNATFKST
jgi:hypothetical protein